MTQDYAITASNRTRQLREKARYDKSSVHGVLDAALVAQVGFVQQGAPVVVPMIYGRDGETLYLHGARKARVVRLLEETDVVCINVTLIDGIVLARSAFNSSMNYRSATIFGSPSLIEGRDEKLQAMKVISEHTMPGRWDELRRPHEKEIKMTGVLAVTIESASAKISAGMPEDEDDDYALAVWAGVLPVSSHSADLVDDDRLAFGLKPSATVLALQNKAF